jgi:hypothetical protein
MTATLPWPTAATFPVSMRYREAGRIRGTAPVCNETTDESAYPPRMGFQMEEVTMQCQEV